MAETLKQTRPPPVSHVLETCLYVKSMSSSVDFYKNKIGLKTHLETPRITTFPLGATLLLIFQLGLTSEDSRLSPDSAHYIPGHGPSNEILDLLQADDSNAGQNAGGAKLKQHFCLAVPSASDVEEWKEYFKGNDVPVVGTMDWPLGGKSVYFADPDGHVGEIGSKGIWPSY